MHLKGLDSNADNKNGRSEKWPVENRSQGKFIVFGVVSDTIYKTESYEQTEESCEILKKKFTQK